MFSILLLQFVHSAILPGPCPHLPGQIKTNLNMKSKKPDLDKLYSFLGPWMIMVEEKAQAAQITCPGTRFDLIDDKLLRQSQSYFIPRSKRKNTKDGEDEYLIHMNELLHFRHSDPTIGFLENASHHSTVEDMISDIRNDTLNVRLFDSQFIKYS